ncbi:hypothetical protein [Roseinatronobacter alkalisoli]|uniref:Uncharacterized protein n=1 Tax=Roseinatronobacter alkalisoli TaxID=3028235 RepID=A0ABT5T4J4_9RHOB|nr:hypothetical protein [Roseinatronobacter sp. HJB301]MDD7970032.1 hypothetical protein [Roseinatronobacter sp. HJB301]
MSRLPLALALALGFATPAFAADSTPGPVAPAAPFAAKTKSRPAIGLGLTVAFGSGRVETGIGLRVFSGNRRNRAVGSLSLDYMFNSQSLRAGVGVAYLGNNIFGGADVGYNFTHRDIDFGLNLGGANTRRGNVQAPAPVAPPVTTAE